MEDKSVHVMCRECQSFKYCSTVDSAWWKDKQRECQNNGRKLDRLLDVEEKVLGGGRLSL